MYNRLSHQPAVFKFESRRFSYGQSYGAQCQWKEVDGGCRFDRQSAQRATQRSQSYRKQIWLRRRSVWGVHGVARRAADTFVHYAGWSRCRQTNRHHRRSGKRWQTASAAGSFHQGRCDAMRVLHFGDDHVGKRFVEQEPEAEQRRNHQWNERQHLSLRNISANCRGDSNGLRPACVWRSEGGGEMIDEQDVIKDVEPERYELFEAPTYNFQFDRRDFIKAFGLGIVFIVPATRVLAQQRGQGESGRGGSNERLPQEIGAWIHVDEDGVVTVFTGKVEVGQNTRTSLTQAVADELHVPVASVRMVMGDTDRTPFDAGTFGSRSTPTMAPQLRKAAAAAREMLIAMAAEQLKVEPNDLRIIDARFVNHDKSKTLTLAEVAKGRNLVKVIPEDIAITQPKDWTVAGTSVTKVNARDYVSGKHQYTSDIKREGMVYGKIVRPSAFNATLVSVDTKAAEAIPGVKVVTDGSFIGVVAPDQQ